MRFSALVFATLLAQTCVFAQITEPEPYPIGPPVGHNPGDKQSLYPPGEPGKRYVTAKLDVIPALVVDNEHGSSHSAASSYTPSSIFSGSSHFSSRFRELAQRTDPIVRHGSCPSGCQPAPRASKEGNGENLNPTANDNPQGTSLHNRPSSSQRDESIDLHGKDSSDSTVSSVRHSGTLPRCPHGCMVAHEFL